MTYDSRHPKASKSEKSDTVFIHQTVPLKLL